MRVGMTNDQKIIKNKLFMLKLAEKGPSGVIVGKAAVLRSGKACHRRGYWLKLWSASSVTTCPAITKKTSSPGTASRFVGARFMAGSNG